MEWIITTIEKFKIPNIKNCRNCNSETKLAKCQEDGKWKSAIFCPSCNSAFSINNLKDERDMGGMITTIAMYNANKD